MSRERSPRLGRGLAALLGEPVFSTQSETHDVGVDQLEANPNQPRGPIDDQSLQELAASIRTQGLLQPLLVRRIGSGDDRFQIVAGERRWRAATMAGLKSLPCLIQPLDDQQSAAAALVENLQRLDLNALEEANGYERLLSQFDITQDVVADLVGKSRSHIANTLRLLRLPEKVQQLVRTGRLSAGHARALLAHPDPVVAAEQVLARGLTVRQTEALTERMGSLGATPSRPPPDDATPYGQGSADVDPDVAAIERDLADHLGLSVTLRARGGRGSLTLRFTHLDQLDHLLARLGRSGPS